MSATAADTSVLVAGLLGWHESHGPALAALRAAIASEGGLVIAVPALVEAFAVMTRLPAPHRLAPERAGELLLGSLENRCTIVGLSGPEIWKFLRSLVAERVSGGRTYDAAILACAVKARAKRLLTLDAGDFTRLEARGIQIVVPQ